VRSLGLVRSDDATAKQLAPLNHDHRAMAVLPRSSGWRSLCRKSAVRSGSRNIVAAMALFAAIAAMFPSRILMAQTRLVRSDRDFFHSRNSLVLAENPHSADATSMLGQPNKWGWDLSRYQGIGAAYKTPHGVYLLLGPAREDKRHTSLLWNPIDGFIENIEAREFKEFESKNLKKMIYDDAQPAWSASTISGRINGQIVRG